MRAISTHTHPDGVSAQTITDDGSRLFWGESDQIVVVAPDGYGSTRHVDSQSDDPVAVLLDGNHDAGKVRPMTAAEAAEHDAEYAKLTGPGL